MKQVPPRAARATFAKLIIGDEEFCPAEVGSIRLRPHQSDGVARIVRSLDKFGGALLCDRVGLGKTFTAAAVIRHFSSAIIVAPASLLSMWDHELRRAAIVASLISQETFSRSVQPKTSGEIVVVDEAHHFRNTRTNRFRNLSAFVGRSRVLLLTATPVHNRRNDIVTLLSLFLGGRASLLTDSEFAECVIRRDVVDGIGFPKRVYSPAESPPFCPNLRHRILSLPPPIPPRGGDGCAALVQFTLLRQWASSDAALRSGLRKRLSRAHALMNALEQGTYPTREELEGWLTGEADVQLGLAGLLAEPGGDAELLSAIQAHEAGTANLYALLAGTSAADDWRVEYLRTLRKKYSGRKLVAFTQFASTARHLFRAMKDDPAIGLITSQKSEIASGSVTREFILSRFAPLSTGSPVPSTRESITLLIATDLCSEGLNLQDASVLVHLDLPWTPARIEQRIGRIARPGGPNPEIFIHSISIPEIAEDLLRMAERLHDKSATSAVTVGVDESTTIDCRTLSIPDATQQVRRILDGWNQSEISNGVSADPVVCVMTAGVDCFVAAVRAGGSNCIIAGDRDEVTRDPRKVLASLLSLSSATINLDDSDVSAIASRIRSFLSQQALEGSLGIHRSDAPSRQTVTRRIDAITSRLQNHTRALTATIADSARRAVAGDFNAASESRLRALTYADSTDEEWLEEIIATAEMAPKTKAESIDGSGFQVLALLIGRKP